MTAPRTARAGIAVAAFLAATGAFAAASPPGYPAKPVRIVVGIAPGGGLDAMTRLAAQRLSARWGQSVIVDNRPGGGTVIAMDIVAHAAPDGYTLLAASDTILLNGVLKRAAYDIRTRFIPIVQLTSQPYLLVVHPGLPVKTFAEWLAHAKSRPGSLRYGSQGMGTTGHIGWERLRQAAGIDVVHVPYKGAAPAVIDTLSGQVHMTFSTLTSSGVHVRAGRLRAIAITSPRRSDALPDMPTVAESGIPGYACANAYAYYAVAGTPTAIVEAINAVVAREMNSPDIVRTMAADGSEVAPPASPARFKAKFDRDYAELEALIRGAGIRLE